LPAVRRGARALRRALPDPPALGRRPIASPSPKNTTKGQHTFGDENSMANA